MKKSSAISLIVILSVLSILVIAFSGCMVFVLSAEKGNIDRLDSQPGRNLYSYCRCIRVDADEEQQAIEGIEKAFSSDEEFLGVYRYPDVDMVDSIRKGGQTVIDGMDFCTFEYNEAVAKYYAMPILEGSMFEFRDYSADETLPVVVTDDIGLSVGDEIQVVFNVNTEEYNETPTVSCTGKVCGITQADRYIPFNQQTIHYGFRGSRSVVYTPNLDAYRAQYDYVNPYEKTGWIPYYVMFSTNIHSLSEDGQGENEKRWEALNQFAYVDENAERNDVFFTKLTPVVEEAKGGWAPEFLNDKMNNINGFSVLMIGMIVLTVLCVASMVTLLVTVIVKWRKEV